MTSRERSAQLVVLLALATPACTATVIDDSAPMAAFDPTDPSQGNPVPGLEGGSDECVAGVTVVASYRHHELAGADHRYNQILELEEGGRLAVGPYTIRRQEADDTPWLDLGDPPWSSDNFYRQSVGSTVWLAGGARTFVSHDAGSTWTEYLVDGERDAFVSGIPHHIGNGDMVFGGEGELVYASPDAPGVRIAVPELDGAADWYDGPSIVSIVKDGDWIVAADAWGGIARTQDPSASWEILSRMPTADERPEPALARLGDRLVALTYGGEVWWSTDNGASWVEGGAAGARGTGYQSLVHDGETLVAIADGGIQLSGDAGASWGMCHLPYIDHAAHLEWSPDGTLWVVGWQRIYRVRIAG